MQTNALDDILTKWLAEVSVGKLAAYIHEPLIIKKSLQPLGTLNYLRSFNTSKHANHLVRSVQGMKQQRFKTLGVHFNRVVFVVARSLIRVGVTKVMDPKIGARVQKEAVRISGYPAKNTADYSAPLQAQSACLRPVTMKGAAAQRHGFQSKSYGLPPSRLAGESQAWQSQQLSARGTPVPKAGQ
jgi:hypothetical protein